MALAEAIASGRFVVTTEVAPPKGCHLEHMIETEAEPCRGRVDGFNVTDLQSAAMRASSLVGCLKLQEAGLHPIMQMVCRDRNRIAIQSDLLGAAALGIRNCLCLSGDHQIAGAGGSETWYTAGRLQGRGRGRCVSTASHP